MRVEFLGIPRERVGMAELDVEAATLGELLTTLERRFPTLVEVVQSGCLRAAFAANLNGDRFIRDPQTRLGSNDCVLILSADAGG